MKKTLPKLTEFFSIPFILYAHVLIAYRYLKKGQGKNEDTQKSFPGDLPENTWLLEWRSGAAYTGSLDLLSARPATV